MQLLTRSALGSGAHHTSYNARRTTELDVRLALPFDRSIHKVGIGAGCSLSLLFSVDVHAAFQVHSGHCEMSLKLQLQMTQIPVKMFNQILSQRNVLNWLIGVKQLPSSYA